jgi:hypothetical protein
MIVQRLRPYFEKSLTKKPLPTEIKVASVIHMLAHGSSFRGDSELFGLSPETMHRAFIVFLNAAKREFWSDITMPNEAQREKSKSVFELKATRVGAEWIPPITGAVDGTHINIRAPSKNPVSYINRKQKFSLNVQALVNANMEFIHVYVGAPGRVHDQNIFSQSKVVDLVPDGWLILGIV